VVFYPSALNRNFLQITIDIRLNVYYFFILLVYYFSCRGQYFVIHLEIEG